MPVGTQEFEYHLGKQFFEDMESADIHDADINVALTVEHRNDMYDLRFKVVGTVTTTCDRCLDDLVLPVDTTWHIAVKYGEEWDDASDDLLVIPESDNWLNVAYMLYDTVALTLPIKHVHAPGECNRAMSALLRKHRVGDAAEADDDEPEGLPAGDDIDMPADPRWNELKKLTDNN